MQKVNYCLGFMFNKNTTEVLLIEKQKPDWQKGMINGIGGKVESGETALDAMTREFKEETGINTYSFEWRYVITIGGDDWRCDVFTCKTDDVFKFETMTDETVILFDVNELKNFNLISNLYWLIELCMDSGATYKISNRYNS